jgi:hydroxyacylglutathione hydrolase
MKIEQIFTTCLAEMAYYIESNREAVVIDPLRETAPYTERADNDNAKIKYIFLTHFHADFVSGHVDLAKKTGATIVYGPGAIAEYDLYNGTDGERFKIGNVELEILHTPGHTMESISLLLRDEKGKEQCLFSGDALFIGDVGRPDLAIKQGDLTEKDLAKYLYNSLRSKIMTLPDDIIIYPNHGAGSACGKSMSKETYDTLGHQKEVNYALRADMTEIEFVNEVLTGLVAPPQYFPRNVGMNKGINTGFDEVVKKGTRKLSLNDFKLLVSEGALILDTRHQNEFIKEHIPNSIFIGLNGQFAPWVGSLIKDIDQKIVIVSDHGKEQETVTRLARIGYDFAQGYLLDPINSWKDAGNDTASISQITPKELETLNLNSNNNILDVRNKTEFYSEHIIGALNEPLDSINTNIENLDKDKTYYVHCAGGYRSVIFESIAKAKGIHNLVDVAQGFNGIKEHTKINVSEYVCSSTML